MPNQEPEQMLEPYLKHGSHDVSALSTSMVMKKQPLCLRCFERYVAIKVFKKRQQLRFIREEMRRMSAPTELWRKEYPKM